MSLDVSLHITQERIEACPHCGGEIALKCDKERVYDANITHNLNRMAEAAGIYQHLWRPDETGVTKARELIEPLRAGLKKLRANPSHFRQFDASNRWGTYEHLVPWVEKYLLACQEYPDADISVSR